MVGKRKVSSFPKSLMMNITILTCHPGDFMRDFSEKLVPLMEDDVRVMIYAGDQDLICNWLGNKRWVDALEWAGAQGWAAAETKPWFTKNKQSGNVTSFENLSFVKVFGAVSRGTGCWGLEGVHSCLISYMYPSGVIVDILWAGQSKVWGYCLAVYASGVDYNQHLGREGL
jgi:hypothetical protein